MMEKANVKPPVHAVVHALRPHRRPHFTRTAMSQQTKRSAQFIPLILLLVTIATFGGGYANSTLPPDLSATEKATLKTARMAFTVGVETYKFPAYSDALVKALRNTGLFVRVDHLERFSSPPALVARVKREIYGSSAIPLWTLLTLGLVPTKTEESFGYAFSLSRPGLESRRIPVEYSYRGRTTLGWEGLFLRLSPNYSIDPESSQRFRGRLALAILDHEDEFGK
jgi:hypothetical protein